MDMKTGTLNIIAACLAIATLQGCRHPLAITGEGNIVDVNGSGHGCTFRQFQADDTACTQNEVNGEYHVNYKAKPRPGWRFVRWDGPCAPDSDFQKCRLNASEAEVRWWDENYPDETIPPSTAVFQPINGETGFLVAPDPVAGVTYETPSLQGVTGLDGSFQYEKGETVRFLVGDTLLGEVTGQAQVTPFDLAASEVLTGTPRVKEALGDEDDPFHAVINLSTLLQSLDHDAQAANGIQIRQSIATLFGGVSLDVSQHWEAFAEEFGLRHAMGQANTKRLFSKPHGIAKPERALQQLYNTLDIDPQITGVSQYRSGTMDMPDSESVSRWQYNNNGYVARYEGAVDLVGSAERATLLYNYDPGGNLTRYDTVFNAGFIYIVSRRFDVYGSLVRIESSSAYDAIPDDVPPGRVRYYEYNVDGSVTSEKVGWDRAGGGDGSQELKWTYKYDYDTSGNLTRERYAEDRDGDGDGSQEQKWTYKYDYDASGNLTGQTVANNGVGLPRSTSTYKYDAHGNLVDYKRGHCHRKVYEYDDQNNLTRYQESRSCDGIPSQVLSYEYDDRGNLTQKKSEQQIENWQFDNNNKQTRYVMKYRPTDLRFGETDRITTWLYDSHGNPTRKESAEYYAQELKNRTLITWQYQYDADGNLTREESNQNGDGSVDSIKTWHNGNITRHEMGDRVETYKYGKTEWGHIFSDYTPLPAVIIQPTILRPQAAPPNPLPALP